jgi:prepilin-type N-terminal cleavage/methylation domain-containing protein/prepilin-type processing-associated H-X9-DG protein
VRKRRGFTLVELPAVSRRKAAGFTLVELLVVIGVIALLISILLPALNRAREAGKRVKCMSNIRQVGMAFLQYTMDNGGRFPTAARGGIAAPYLYEDWVYWQPGRDVKQSRIVKYIGHFKTDVLVCPSDNLDAHPARFPSASKTKYPFSYTMNEYYNSESIAGYKPPNPPLPSVRDYYPERRQPKIKNAAEKVLVIEEDEHINNASANSGINDGIWDPGSLMGGQWHSSGDLLAIRHQWRQQQGVDDATATNPIPNRSLRGNVAFVDGHAEFAAREYVHHVLHVIP